MGHGERIFRAGAVQSVKMVIYIVLPMVLASILDPIIIRAVALEPTAEILAKYPSYAGSYLYPYELFLGAAVCGMAFALDMPLVLILVGLVYIVETLSVMMQVTYFKLTHGKRIFRMTPIHHHFELGGWSEIKIWTVFVTVTCVMCILAGIGVMNRF